MNVHGVGNSQAWGNIRPEQGDMSAREARHAAREAARPSAVDAAVADGEGGGARGVIRLLQEGHFKGVADVRLRINFFDELQAAGAANAGRALDSGVQDLIAKIGDTGEGPLAALLGTDDMTAGDLTALADGFKQDAEEILARFRRGETDLNGALDALDAALMSLAEPAVPAAEPVAEPSTEPAADQAAETIPEMAADIAAEAPVENTEDLSTTVTAAAQDQEGIESTDQPVDTPGPSAYDLLRSELTNLMADLRQSVTDTQALPPLSPPRGNGQAYAKFLEIYNTLIGGSVTEPATGAAAEPVAEPLDVLV